MGSYAYAHRGHKGFVTLGEALDERSYKVGRTLGDYARGCYIPISEEQLAFKEAHPDAVLQEVLEMRIHTAENSEREARES